MSTFLTPEQELLAQEVAHLLIARGETVAVSEGTAGGLVSAALLSVAGASQYYRGGAVLYTLPSRIALAGVSAEQYANYRGTTPEMLATIAEAMRARLDATWCIAESGLAGPTPGRSGTPAGRTTVAVAGPLTRTAVIETGTIDRAENMVRFTTIALRFLRDALRDAPRETPARGQAS
ncbi:MAG: CinA family protein [Dehalococcoidia bacterium]